MKIDLNEMLYAVSAGFDAVERELLGVRYGHCKRIAALSITLGKALGLSADELIDLAAFSILHDNALTQVNQEEIEYKKYNNGEGYSQHDFNMRRCIIGESNTKYMPFRTNNRDVILLHHENADGSGPQGRTHDRTPIKAQIIHLADNLDNNFDLTTSSRDTHGAIIYYVKSNAGTLFSREISDCFCKYIKAKHLNYITLPNIDNYLQKATKHFNDEYSPQEVFNLATLIAMIIDFKSHYTCKHSSGVAVNCRKMANFYKFPEEKITRFYLAGALHDVGKLMIPNEILQKPERLNDSEYETMKMHANYTFEILKHLNKSMQDITIWASHHHEKLNGSGYPLGLNADQLSMEERLMTCCDIYQALTEERAYKTGFSHEKAIEIMRDMVIKGELDHSIVNNMDMVFGDKSWDRSIPTSILTS